MKSKLTGWGQYPIAECFLLRPERYHQLKIEQSPLIARGLGRSYGDAALNSNSYVVLMERLNRFLAFDPLSGILRAEAGVSLQDVLQFFVPEGWFLPVTPGTKFVTLGGCVASDAHGKNHHRNGTFGQYVKELELLLPDGNKKRCSPTKNPEIFWATVGGMGLTGIITELSLQLIPIESAYMRVSNSSAKDLDEILEALEDGRLDDRYSVAWIDCLAKGEKMGRSILMRGHHAEKMELTSDIADPYKISSRDRWGIPFQLPSWVLNSYSVRAFNSSYYNLHRTKKESFLLDYDRYFYPLDAIEHWNRLYGKKGFVQYQFVVPSKQARQGLKEIMQKISDSQRASFLAVLKRFGMQNQGLLSFPREGYTLSLDLPYSLEVLKLLNELDEIVLKFEGRVYLAKDARLKPETFRAMYPQYAQWKTIKGVLDPNQKMSSDLSRRLEIGK